MSQSDDGNNPLTLKELLISCQEILASAQELHRLVAFTPLRSTPISGETVVIGPTADLISRSAVLALIEHEVAMWSPDEMPREVLNLLWRKVRELEHG